MKKIVLFLAAIILTLNPCPSFAASKVRLPKSTTLVTLRMLLDSESVHTTLAAIDAFGIPVAGSGGNSTSSTFEELNILSEFTFTGDIYDTLGATHTLLFCLFHTDTSKWALRSYGYSEDFGESVSGYPRQLTTSAGTSASGTINLTFNTKGKLTNLSPKVPAFTIVAPWSNGSSTTRSISVYLRSMRQIAIQSQLLRFSQNGHAAKVKKH